MKQRNSFTSNDKQTGRRPADMLDIYKYIWSDLCEAYNRTGKFRRTFLSLRLRSTKIVGWPYPVGEVCVTAWHVTSRNQGLSSNDQGRQRRETLGTRLFLIQWLFPYQWRNPCTFWHVLSLWIEHFDKTKKIYISDTIKKTICVTFSCINASKAFGG